MGKSNFKGFWPFFLLVSVAAAAVLFPQAGWTLRQLIGAPFHRAPTDAEALRAENEQLKAELATLESVKGQLPSARGEYRAALVYSRYPFNFKNELFIRAGKRDGIQTGKAAVFGGRLIGKVEDAFPDTAVVRTVFDPRLQLAVRIGNKAAPALLKGGTPPILVLIPLEANVEEGDIVSAAALDLPYGLPLGVLRNMTLSRDNLFREAVLEVGYDPNAVVSLLIAL